MRTSGSSTTVRFFVNGSPVEELTHASLPVPDTQDAWLVGGAMASGSQAIMQAFQGSLDDVRLYALVLPDEEIRSLYLAGWRDTTLTASTGSKSARWSVAVPTGLEGAYRVDLRSTDTAGHTRIAPVWSTADLTSPVWAGNADNIGPRVTVCKQVVSGSTYQYAIVAQDYNLSETGFTSICPITGRSYFRSPWFLTAVPAGTQKLYRFTAGCNSDTTATVQATACDIGNNCTTAGVTTGAVCDAILSGQAASEPAIDANAAALAKAEAAASAAGQPTVPVIAFASSVLTTTQFHAPGAVVIAGTVSGTLHFSDMEVTINGRKNPAILSDPAPSWPFTRTWASTYLLPDPGQLPDGETVQATATVTVRAAVAAAAATAGQSKASPGAAKVLDHRIFLPLVTRPDLDAGRYSAEQTLTLDVVPPAEVDLALTADGSPVSPGAIVRSVAPELTLSWQPSHDGSGLSGYITRWTVTSVETTTVTTRTHDPAGPLTDSFTGGEAQRVTAELGLQDNYGNVRWQEAGPIYLDSPHTPDYIAMDAHGWQENGCSLMGVDRRLYVNGLSEGPQELYATWDRNALRLAWTGARWHVGNGDLFAYLDTKPGGTTQLYIPVALPVLGEAVALPATLQADVMIWLQTADQATVLRWDGSAWTDPTPLTAEQLHFDGGRLGGQIDMVLPFELLGVTPNSSLGLIGLGVQEPAEGRGMELWASLPPFNPVNSPNVSRLAGLAGTSGEFSLLREYRWASLGDDICPNGSDGRLLAKREGDSDLQLSFAADPPGAVFSRQEGGLFWVTDPLRAVQPTGSALGSLVQPRNPPVADGQSLSYTLEYHNRGSATAVGVYAMLSGHGQVRLTDTRLDLGDIPPGGSGTATFGAVADRSQGSLPIAGILALVYDASHGPDGPALDWLVVLHRVDAGAPEAPELALPERVGPLSNLLSGIASDESGVRDVTLDVEWPGGSRHVTCPLSRPADGDWTCKWDAGEPLPDNTELTVRVQATDRQGQTSAWSAPQTIRVDAQPPTVTVDLPASFGAAQEPVVRGALTLYGAASDDGNVSAVTLCLPNAPAPGEEKCDRADLHADGRWSYQAHGLGALDSVTRTVAVWATDDLGNRLSTPLAFDVRVDNVAPVLTANQFQTNLVLSHTVTVLSGTATDGGPSVKVSVRVRPPVGAEFRADTHRSGNDWSYDLTGAEPGSYELWVAADDQAGNRTSAGPFTVDVTCTDASVLVTSLTAEPAPTEPALAALALTLRTVISNTGSDALPAGVPLTFYGRDAVIGTVTTTQTLASGASLEVALGWTPYAEGNWDLTVVPNRGKRAVGDEVLCRIPDEASFTVGVTDLPLRNGWNLVAAPAQPDNPDIAVVQRPISGTYAAILGYQDGLQWHYPAGPNTGSLAALAGGRGYWVRETPVVPPPPGESWRMPTVATLRLAGKRLAEDEPLPLAAGWNLAGYLPFANLPVTTALKTIDGQYAAVLGFGGTGQSYYPDLDSFYDTLQQMTPSAGYWISATKAITLQYPLAGGVPLTVTMSTTATRALDDHLVLVRAAEKAAGVTPTYAWVNLYGQIYLLDGTPAPISTTVTALAGGLPCGATIVREAGRFGLLACYGDDETIEGVDGAQQGAALTLLVGGAAAPMQIRSFNGQPAARDQAPTWTGLGDRWEVVAGLAPGVDLAISKSVMPTVVTPGGAITYTLLYKNAGAGLAQGVVISDHVPLAIAGAAFTSTGAAITRRQGAEAFEWDVADLAAGAGGVITITGVVDPTVADQTVITNTAMISAPLEAWPQDNVTEAALKVSMHPSASTLWMPLIMR
jgi:uncharacterized repeat protein (TIGR01451 family)